MLKKTNNVFSFKLLLVIASSLLVSTSSTYSQGKNTSTANPRYNNYPSWETASLFSGGYWKSYYSDTKYIITAPKYWGCSGWTKAAVITGITGILTAVDDDIMDEVQDNRTSSRDNFTLAFKPVGDGIYTIPAFGLLYLYGHFGKNLKARRTALTAVESLALGGLFGNILQRLSTRERPKNGKKWGGSQIDTTDLAFPSGHAIAGFAVATVVASEYGNIFGVAPLAYCLASLGSLERVNDNKHRPSDIFLGSAIGYFTARTLYKLHNGINDEKITLLPLINAEGTAGLTMNIGW